MKYYPKEVFYEVRDGVNYIILDYGDSKVEHVIAAQQKMHPTLLRARRKMVTCPNCQTVFGVELPAPQGG